MRDPIRCSRLLAICQTALLLRLTNAVPQCTKDWKQHVKLGARSRNQLWQLQLLLPAFLSTLSFLLRLICLQRVIRKRDKSQHGKENLTVNPDILTFSAMRRQIERQKGKIDSLTKSKSDIQDRRRSEKEEKDLMQKRLSSLQSEKTSLGRKAERLSKHVEKLKEKLNGIPSILQSGPSVDGVGVYKAKRKRKEKPDDNVDKFVQHDKVDEVKQKLRKATRQARDELTMESEDGLTHAQRTSLESHKDGKLFADEALASGKS